MRKMLKRALVASFVFILTALCMIPASANSYIVDTGGEMFEVLDDNTMAFAGYEGDYSTVVIPDTFYSKPVVRVNSMALYNNEVAQTIDMTYAVNLETIGIYAFAGCVNLRQIEVPATVTTVGFSVFRGCMSLQRAVFLANENKVPNETFMDCSQLGEVVLSGELEEIGAYAFANCTALEYLELPRTVTAIGANAFLNDTLTLGVYYGTYAMQYAVDNQIPYVLIDNVKLGDAGGDGSVNVSDVTTIQRYLAELEPLEGIYLHAADANQDGTVDISDATIIQMYLAEYEMEYPIGEVITQ